MADEIIFGPWVGGVTSTKATIKAGLANGLTAQLVLVCFVVMMRR